MVLLFFSRNKGDTQESCVLLVPSVELDLTLSPEPDPNTVSKPSEPPPAFLLILTEVSSVRKSLEPDPNPPVLTPPEAKTGLGSD